MSCLISSTNTSPPVEMLKIVFVRDTEGDSLAESSSPAINLIEMSFYINKNQPIRELTWRLPAR